MTPLVVAKFVVLFLFASFVAGVTRDRREHKAGESWAESVICGGAIRFLLGVLCLVLASGLWLGVYILLS